MLYWLCLKMFFLALPEVHMMFCEIKNYILYFPRFHTVFHSYCNKKQIRINFIWSDSMKYYQHSGNQPKSKKISTEKKITIYQLLFQFWSISSLRSESPGVMIMFCNKEKGKKQVQSYSDTVDVHTKGTAAERNKKIQELYSMLRGTSSVS